MDLPECTCTVTNITENWEAFVKYCGKLTYSLQEAKDKISLCKMDGFPPKVVFSVIISNEFEVNYFNGADRVPIRRFFLHFLQSWKHTQFDQILEHMESLKPKEE